MMFVSPVVGTHHHLSLSEKWHLNLTKAPRGYSLVRKANRVKMLSGCHQLPSVAQAERQWGRSLQRHRVPIIQVLCV